jgi:expansin (peptidoglycan-binding protein)
MVPLSSMFRSRLARHGHAFVIIGSLSAFACSSNTASENHPLGGAPGVGGASVSVTGGASQLGGSGGSFVSTGGAAPAGVTGGTSSSGGVASAATGGASALGGTTASATGGAKTTGGATASVTGGTSSVAGGGTRSSGGATSVNTGGLGATGGSATLAGGTAGASTIVATGGAPATGGRAATGGSSSIPTGLPATCGTTNCDNTTPSNPQLTAYGALGNVTEYSTGVSKGGACIYGDTSIMYYAAIAVNLAPGDGKGQWKGGTICGQCFEVTVVTSKGYKSVVIRVTDKCPDGQCGMDLGGSAPSAVMVDGFGRYQGAWRAVSCAGHPEVSDGVPSIHVKDGSNGGWAAIQVRNPVMAVASIDYQDSMNGAISGTMPLSSGIENYYQVPTTVLASFSTIDITVHYVDGSTAKAAITAIQLATPEGTYPLN